MIKSATFETSCTDLASTKKLDPLPQYAFVGRSNVGKSSLLNMLCNRKGLAVTSSTPGRTRLINFFRIELGMAKPLCEEGKARQSNPEAKSKNSTIFFVDLPGYGYAAASKSAKYGWGETITEYLTKSTLLRRVFVLLDIRHKPSAHDEAMLHFLQQHGIPFTILATKSDKFSRAQISNHVRTLAQHLGVGIDNIIATSAKSTLGRDAVMSILN